MMDLVWHGQKAVPELKRLGIDMRVAGETLRATLSQHKVDAALDAIRKAGDQIISLNPVQSTLEDYFLERLSSPATEGAPR
jgi:hypothetical protein